MISQVQVPGIIVIQLGIGGGPEAVHGLFLVGPDARGGIQDFVVHDEIGVKMMPLAIHDHDVAVLHDLDVRELCLAAGRVVDLLDLGGQNNRD